VIRFGAKPQKRNYKECDRSIYTEHVPFCQPIKVHGIYLLTPTTVAGVKRSSASLYVCVYVQHNSKMNDPKSSKMRRLK